MKIIIAPDKFKGSLSGTAFCNIVEEGLKKHLHQVVIKKLPLADGGDGTVDALAFYMGGKQVEIEVHDPLLRKIKASYLLSADKHMAFIEMAHASGIRLLTTEEANPMLTSSFGTGELIRHALENGVKHIILGIGGSATSDAGIGMAKALGFTFYDINNKELEGRGKDLIAIHRIETSGAMQRLNQVSFDIACDVDNPLYGKNGAAHIYGPQKGASAQMVEQLDKGLQNFNRIFKEKVDLQRIPGAGAAGGMGAGAIVFLDAKLKSGIQLMKETADFDNQIKGFDWIITGEGKIDKQTFSGKVIKGIMDSRKNQKLAVFCGASDLTHHERIENKIDYLDEMRSYAKNHDDSMRHSATYLLEATEKFAQQLKL